MEFNTEQAYQLYQKELGITDAAKKFCEKAGIEYEDKYRLRLSRFIDKVDVETDTDTDTCQYENEEDLEPLMPSAWDEESQRFLDIDEFCEKYNLPAHLVRSSKLVSHNSSHMTYNIAFNQSVREVENLALEDIERIVSEHIKPVSLSRTKGPKKSYDETFDRLVFTDVHIGMDPTGSRNITPLYEQKWDREELESRRSQMVDFVLDNKRSSSIVVDELGDFLDGYDSKTSRGGHDLPQNLSDIESYEAGIEFLVRIGDELAPEYLEVEFNFITDSNHGGPTFDYFVKYSAKAILELKYKNVKCNLMTKFINHYQKDSHLFILSHGKDSEALKFGFKPHPDHKSLNSIDLYCKNNGLYGDKFIEFSKGDSHQYVSDLTASNDFDYCSYPAFSPSSNWISTNYKNTKSGFVFQTIVRDRNIKSSTPYFF